MGTALSVSFQFSLQKECYLILIVFQQKQWDLRAQEAAGEPGQETEDWGQEEEENIDDPGHDNRWNDKSKWSHPTCGFF